MQSKNLITFHNKTQICIYREDFELKQRGQSVFSITLAHWKRSARERESWHVHRVGLWYWIDKYFTGSEFLTALKIV